METERPVNNQFDPIYFVITGFLLFFVSMGVQILLISA